MKMEFNAKWGTWTEDFEDVESFGLHIVDMMTESDTIELFDHQLNKESGFFNLFWHDLDASEIGKTMLPDEYEIGYNEYVDSEIMVAWNELENGDVTYIFGMDIKVHEGE